MKLSHIFCTFLLLSYSTDFAFGENILFYWGVSGYSHRLAIWPLIEALTARGHNVTFISPRGFKTPTKHNPRITDIVPESLSREISSFGDDYAMQRWEHGPHFAHFMWSEYFDVGKRTCRHIMNDLEVVDRLKQSTFDLVVIDSLFNDCGYGLVDYYKAPYIQFSPTAVFPWMTDSYGFPDENLPEMQYSFPKQMNFVQRVINLLRPLYWMMKKHYDMYPELEALTQKALGLQKRPDFDAIERNVSLVMVYTHTSIDLPRSLPPMFVDVGGMHCNDERKPIPKDILQFIESGNEEGFVLLSFGTYLSLSSAPKFLQSIFFDAIRQISNVKFVVKFEGAEVPSDLPKNAKLVGWIPQQDIIAHPKIKAFISHGGLLGTQEAVYHAVPSVVVPIFAEQDYNAMRVEERGTGIQVELAGLTSKVLETAIREVVFNQTYKKNCIKSSQVFKDRQNSPLETSLWWVEHVLRYKGTVNLRPDRITETWFMRRSLDVWGFLLVVIIVLLAFSTFMIQRAIMYGCGLKRFNFTRSTHGIKKLTKKSN